MHQHLASDRVSVVKQQGGHTGMDLGQWGLGLAGMSGGGRDC
jgi:hypothetical protein